MPLQPLCWHLTTHFLPAEGLLPAQRATQTQKKHTDIRAWRRIRIDGPSVWADADIWFPIYRGHCGRQVMKSRRISTVVLPLRSESENYVHSLSAKKCNIIWAVAGLRGQKKYILQRGDTKSHTTSSHYANFENLHEHWFQLDVKWG
jgi:hypothetical protein